jgi:hypothetical protein
MPTDDEVVWFSDDETAFEAVAEEAVEAVAEEVAFELALPCDVQPHTKRIIANDATISASFFMAALLPLSVTP